MDRTVARDARVSASAVREGLSDRYTQVSNAALFAAFYLDDILSFYEPIGSAADYAPTDDHVLGHIALSVSSLEPWRERARTQGIEVVAGPAKNAGFNSFFVRGPDGLLIELVEAAPSSELCPTP